MFNISAGTALIIWSLSYKETRKSKATLVEDEKQVEAWKYPVNLNTKRCDTPNSHNAVCGRPLDDVRPSRMVKLSKLHG